MGTFFEESTVGCPLVRCLDGYILSYSSAIWHEHRETFRVTIIFVILRSLHGNFFVGQKEKELRKKCHFG